MSIEEIMNDEKQSEEFINKLKRFATKVGELLFEPLPKEQVLGTFKTQGYWSGSSNRIHYDETAGFVAQPRLF